MFINYKKIIICIPIFSIVFFVIGVILFFSINLSDFSLNKEDVPHLKTEASTKEYMHGYESKMFFDQAYTHAGEVKSVRASSAIVAHHLLVAEQIAKTFETIARDDVKRVVLLSPNHFSVGSSPAQISTGVWNTPYGNVNSDTEVVDYLVDKVDVLVHDEGSFGGEHGIASITPFIAISFPQADVVAITLDELLSVDDARELGETLSKLEDTIVIGSIDFSHLQSGASAMYHDAISLRVIEAGGCSDFTCGVHLEIDSNATLQTLFAYNKAVGAQQWNLLYHDSSIGMGLADKPEDNTSHVLGYFTASDNMVEDPEPSFASIHFVGDIMLDRGVRTWMNNAQDVGYPWKHVDRLLMGSHLRVGNLEGNVSDRVSKMTVDPPFRFTFSTSSVGEMNKYVDVVSLANNHIRDFGISGEEETKKWLDELDIPYFGSWTKPEEILSIDVAGNIVTFVGYNVFSPTEDVLIKTVTEASDRGEFVVVIPHWGNEYVSQPNTRQIRLAENLSAAGADLIIGGHPHVPQTVDVIGNTPVVYSLGNFVFDQMIPDTYVALTAGLIFDENGARLHLIPVYTKNGQPVLLPEEESSRFFQELASRSNSVLSQQLLTGVINISYEATK